MRFPHDVPVLTDGVVTLRAHRESDVPDVYEQCQDPTSQEWTTIPVPYGREDAVRFVREMVVGGWRDDVEWAFAVEAADGDGRARFAGTVSLRDEGEGRAELAYGSHPWARGRGVMTRALRLLLRWGFEERGLATVVWWAYRGNWASRKLAWRVGVNVGGTVRQWLPQRGVLRDTWVGELVAGEPLEPRHPWFGAPRLHGPGLVLREIGERDVRRVVEACSDEGTAYWLTTLPSPYTERDAVAWLEEVRAMHAAGTGVAWAVADPGDDLLLGVVTAFDLTPDGAAEIGYWAHPRARGRGLTSAAVRLVVRHCFVPTEDGGLGRHRVRAYAAEGNDASIGVLRANGFVETGRMRRDKRLRDGSYVDLLHFDLLAEEYAGP